MLLYCANRVPEITSELDKMSENQGVVDLLLFSNDPDMDATINLHQYEIIFKAYNQPARFNGLLNNDGSYKSSWRALKKEDYLHFINSSEYNGDSTGMRKKITPL